MGLEISGGMLRLPGQPNHPHILETSTDLTNWIPWLTNTSPDTVTDLLDTNAPMQDRRFYRGVKP